MKYGKHLETKQNPAWKDYYIDYAGLKDLIKAAQAETGSGENTNFSPRTTSLTVQRYNSNKGSSEERFFTKLEQDVDKVNKFTTHLVTDLRAALRTLQAKYDKDPSNKDPARRAALINEAQRIGDEFLALEKFVNLNYMGFHKILKKHDKCLPHAPCRQFYIAHLHQQPWVQGNFSDLLVTLSNIHSLLRGDTSGTQNDDAAQGFVRSTTKYWVRNEDVSAVKHHVLQQLPVFQHDKNNFAGDAQLVNSVYLDNSSMELYHGRLDKTPGALALRIRWYGNAPPKSVFVERKTHRESWKGEESVKERFMLPEDKVVPYLDGEYTLDQALQDMEMEAKRKGKTLSEAERESYSNLFLEVYKAVDSKQLRPLVRTQYMRTAFQIPFDSTVRISLDTNLCMIKENPEDGPTCAATGRWYRDPNLAIHRTEITRFPHAVLEVKLSLPEGQQSPSWVQDMIESGYLTEVHKFSKFIHGSATLFPDLVRAVPYWVDDESVRASMLASAPSVHDPAPGQPVLPTIPDIEHGAGAATSSTPLLPKPRRARERNGIASNHQAHGELSHPLLGDQPTLKLMPDSDEVRGFGHTTGASSNGGAGGSGGNRKEPNIFQRMLGLTLPAKSERRPTPMKLEPKSFFANERTFLAWLHMAITLGSIAAALLGFSAGTDATGPKLSRHLVELIALMLLPLAIGITLYALQIFVWRAQNIAKKKATHFDDRVGPLGLCAAVVVTLSAITILSVVDFWQLYVSKAEDGPAAPPKMGASLLSAAAGLVGGSRW